MKIYPLQWLHSSCGISAASLLTGESLEIVKKKVLKIRNSNPSIAKRTMISKDKISQDTESTYIWELVRYLKSKKVKVGRFQKAGDRLNKLGKKYEKGAYLLNFRHHLAILKEGLVYDNGSHQGQSKTFYTYRRDKLDSVAKLG